MEREIVDIADVAEIVEVRESWCQWCVHSVLFGEGTDDRCIWLHAVEAVQPHQWRTIARPEDDLAVAAAKVKRLRVHRSGPLGEQSSQLLRIAGRRLTHVVFAHVRQGMSVAEL